jgi:NAD(P)-dependent dehydrogenase (short-subunit alcohol dehydrogenase family)
VGPHGIRVNSVIPGAIRIEQEVEMALNESDVANDILLKQALKRRG